MALLTDTKARNLKPDDKPIPHGGVTGLTLHPSGMKGHGKWVLRYVSPVTGRRRNAGLGSYPEVSIASAAKVGQNMRDLLVAGSDPLERKMQGEDKPSIPSFEQAARQVHEDLLPGWKNPKHGKQWIATLEQYAFPTIGSKLIDKLTPGDMAEVLRPIWLTIPETASRVRQRLHAVMAWGWAHGHCSANPVDVVNHLLAQQPGKTVRTEHHPAMPWRDIPSFVEEYLKLSGSHDVTRALLMFLILTATRSGEARGMDWSEVDMEEGIWTIPAERMKAKQSQRIPLSCQAIKILATRPEPHAGLVFPSPRSQSIPSDMVLTSFLRRVKAPCSTANRVATAHGFRSSFRDWCSEHNYARDLAERALAHAVQNKVEAAYHRTDLLELRRPMMQAWSDFVCDKILIT